MERIKYNLFFNLLLLEGENQEFSKYTEHVEMLQKLRIYISRHKFRNIIH